MINVLNLETYTSIVVIIWTPFVDFEVSLGLQPSEKWQVITKRTFSRELPRGRSKLALASPRSRSRLKAHLRLMTLSTGSDRKKDVFEEIKKMNTTLRVVAKDVTTKELKDSLEDIKVRLGEAEQRISDIEDASALTEAKVDKCEERQEVLWSRVEDLENRSRRNNVWIIGLKEGVEEPGKVDQYVTDSG